MRLPLLGAAFAALLANPAAAGPVFAKDGRFEADVSARQMSRISVLGEKIASIRKIDDPGGPQMLVETDEKSGDLFVAFDGDVSGRVFNAFLTTESGRVVQAILHPTAGEGQTILVKLDFSLATNPSPPAGALRPDPTGERAPVTKPGERGAYPETLVQFVRLMFADQETDGVTRRVATAAAVRAGPFSVREISRWESQGLLGRVLYVTNVDKTEAPIRLEAFLVERVFAVAASHERLRPGEQARVFIVEEPR
jgi:hypothetical protein